jgi:hypothetical protein
MCVRCETLVPPAAQALRASQSGEHRCAVCDSALEPYDPGRNKVGTEPSLLALFSSIWW